MTPLQWILLCVLFILYLLFGGSVFMYFEQHREIEKKEEISVLRKDIKEILIMLDRDFYHNETTRDMIHALTTAKLGVIHRISSVCDVGDLVPENDIGDSSTTTTPQPTDETENDDEGALKWNFYNSVFFSFTVITTIGYGHLAPSTVPSKYFVMIYALIGIPINSILLSGLGDYFTSRLVKVHQKSKDKPTKKFTLFFETLFYLIPGILVFIVLPAFIFEYIESWSYLDSVYFCFVSLTTIGFGDLVAGMSNGHTIWMWIYKSSIIIWIIFGLGYLIMILGFISKGMTHKKVRVVIEKRLNTIRFTKEKLSRDIDYMRRVVNELYLMKIKPVYDDHLEAEEELQLQASNSKRTQSQPCIKATPLRRHYNSVPQLTEAAIADAQNNNSVKFTIGDPSKKRPKLTRRCSDSDLSHIDRDKTFESAIRQQVTVDELLITVVNALSGNVMNEMIEAVEELNELEDEILMEKTNVASGGLRNSNSNKSIQSLSSSVHDKFDLDDHSVPAWDLGALSESDEEVLIEEDEDDDKESLRQVVVHSGEQSGGGMKTSASTSILDKFSGAKEYIRKISAGSRISNEGPSRKVSRNESLRKKLPRNDSSEKRLSLSQYHHNRHYLNPLANGHSHFDRKTGQQRKISEGSRVSNMSDTGLSSQQITPMQSNPSSRKISPSDNRLPKLSLESTSLREFLQALDNVHSRLNNNKTSVTSMGGDSSTYSDYDGGIDYHHDQIVPGGGRHSGTAGTLGGGGNNNIPRRRKNGITHPSYSYVNDNFVMDDEKENTEKSNNMEQKKDSSPTQQSGKK